VAIIRNQVAYFFDSEETKNSRALKKP